MYPSARIILTAALLAAACKGVTSSATDTPDARESPQASAQPAILAVAPTTPASAQPNTNTEGGPPPAPFRGDEILNHDSLTKEPIGYTLSAVFRPNDVIGPLRAPEVSTQGNDAAKKATELRLAIDFSPTRMRVGLVGQGYVLPPNVEIRARADRYGHVILWPIDPEGHLSYRALAPGSMRAVLGERRFDVAPIAPAEIQLREEVGRRISIRTRRADVTTRAAHASFEIGKLDSAGEGGVLLCRLLLDLMNAPPGTPICAFDELPVRVELRWTNNLGGSLVFELTGALKRNDVPIASLLVPPSSANYSPTPMTASGFTPMLTQAELLALHSVDVDVPPTPVPGAPPPSPNSPPAPVVVDPVLAVFNPSVELRVLYLDGVPALWAAPNARGELRGLHRGRYVAQWRTFLGDSVETAVTQSVPGSTEVGKAAPFVADAGARP
jgi:hypothetical protein